MKRIGVSQRVHVVEAYEERRDCLDQRWGPLLRSFDYVPIPLFNRIEDVEGYLTELDLDGVVLTGGNDLETLEDGSNVAPERDAFERKLVKFALEREIPVLGVCRGLQFLNVHFGGELSTVSGHVAESHEVVLTEPPVFKDTGSVTTNSYHNYGITVDDLADGFRSVGRAGDGTVEWVEHVQRPVSGIMWHPERESPSEELDRRIITGRFRCDTR